MDCFWPGLYLFGLGPLGFLLYTSPPLSLSPHSQLQPSAAELAARAFAELLSLRASHSLLPPLQFQSKQPAAACCFLLPLPCCLLPPLPSVATATIYIYDIYSPAICWTIIWMIRLIRDRLIILIVN